MKIKSTKFALFAALTVFCCFFALGDKVAHATNPAPYGFVNFGDLYYDLTYSGNFNNHNTLYFGADPGSSSSRLWQSLFLWPDGTNTFSANRGPNLDVYNITTNGGQNAAPNWAISYWPVGYNCTRFNTSRIASGTGWLTLTPQNAPYPVGQVPPTGYTRIDVNPSAASLGTGVYCATVEFGTATPPADSSIAQNKVNIIFDVSDSSAGCSISSFEANPSNVSSGGSTGLSWLTQGCTSGTLSGGSFNNKDESSQIAIGFENTGPLSSTTTYTLTAQPGNVTATYTVTVGVQPLCTSGGISFDVDGYSAVGGGPGSNFTLNWVVPVACSSGILTQVSGPNDVGLSQGATGTGSKLAQSTNVGVTVYRLTVQPGNITKDVTITVASQTCTINSFSASPSSISSGSNTTLLWNTSNCTSATLNGGSFSNKNENAQLTTGNENTGSLNSNTTYTFLAQPGNVSATTTVTITGSTCTITSFTATPSTIGNGNSSLLKWTTSSACESVTIKGGAYVTATSVALNNSTGLSVSPSSTTTYTLDAKKTTAPASADTKTTTVTVAVLPCTVGNISITANGQTSISVYLNDAVTLAWTLPSTCTASSYVVSSGPNDNSMYIPTAPPGGSNPARTSPWTGTTTYTLWAVDGSNNYYSTTATVTVSPSPTCTIIVNSFNNGVAGLPASGFSFVVSNGSGDTVSDSLTSVNTKTYSNRISQYTYTATAPTGYGSGSTYNNITPANSQTCLQNSTITFNYNFTSSNPPGDPQNPTAENNSINAAVACGQIKVSWAAGSNAASYKVYRNSTNVLPGAPLQSGIVALTYTDTTPLASGYYWVQSVNAAGNSSAVVASNTPIAPTACQVNLGTSGKVVTAVNGVAYTFSSSCVASQTGTVKTIKNNDVVTFAMNICNNGSIDATSVSVTDDITGSNIYNVRNIVITGGGSSSTAGNVTTFNLGTITAGTKKTITYDADVKTPTGGTQTLYRFRNQANITYSSSGGAGSVGCTGTSATAGSPCKLDTGFIVFYNGQKAPIIKEVTP